MTFTIDMANLPNFLQKQGSYMSRLLQRTWPWPGSPCFFGMPPALYTQFKLLPKCQSIMYIARVGSHTIFLGVFHDSTSLSQSSSVVDFTGEVLVTWCSGKGSKYSSFQLVSLLANCNLHHFNTTIFCCRIIYVDVELRLFRWKNTCIRNIIYETNNTAANVL